MINSLFMKIERHESLPSVMDNIFILSLTCHAMQEIQEATFLLASVGPDAVMTND